MAKTRLTCERTDGHNAKEGIRLCDYCPFCGHPTNDGKHEFEITDYLDDGHTRGKL